MGRWERGPSPAAAVCCRFQGDGCTAVVAEEGAAKGEAGVGSGRSRGLSRVLFRTASAPRGVLSAGGRRAGRGPAALTSTAPCDEGK